MEAVLRLTLVLLLLTAAAAGPLSEQEGDGDDFFEQSLQDLDGLFEPEEPPEELGVVARRRRPQRPHPGRAYEHAARSQGEFGLDAFKVLVARDNSSNAVLSPLSVGTALAMLFAGSRGRTADQLWTALHLSGAKRDAMHSHRRLVRHTRKHSRDGVTVAVASELFTSAALPLNPKFPRYAAGMFGSSVTPLPFELPELAAELINGRCFNATAGAIDGLVTPDMLGEETQFVLANAVYFRGSWQLGFDEAETTEGVFHSPLGPRTVHLMSAEKVFPVAELPELGARALLMPYQGEKLGMLVLLPNDPDGVDALAASLNMSVVSDALGRLEGLGDVLVRLPRFDVEAQLDLQPLLMELGVEDLFDPATVNLTRVTGRRGAAISTAVHKARVGVSERGTEASAATAFANFFRSGSAAIAPFVVDRPFVFAVLEMRAPALLFIGRVATLGTEVVSLDTEL